MGRPLSGAGGADGTTTTTEVGAAVGVEAGALAGVGAGALVDVGQPLACADWTVGMACAWAGTAWAALKTRRDVKIVAFRIARCRMGFLPLRQGLENGLAMIALIGYLLSDTLSSLPAWAQ